MRTLSKKDKEKKPMGGQDTSCDECSCDPDELVELNDSNYTRICKDCLKKALEMLE